MLLAALHACALSASFALGQVNPSLFPTVTPKRIEVLPTDENSRSAR
jgi:hypothetical protein